MIRVAVLCAIIVFLSSCARVFSPTKNIQVKVIDSASQNDLGGVICAVTDGSGKLYKLATSPGIVKVQKSATNLLIVCKKDGYKQLSILAGEDFVHMTPVDPMLWYGFHLEEAIKGENYPNHYLILMQDSSL